MTVKTVLVVDDEPDIVALISYNLKKQGFSVASASGGEEALGMVRKGGIDLLVLDLMLPGLHGMEICRIIRSDPRTAHLPIIMLTARGDEHERVQGLDTGADDYMTKPFSPKELAARVKAVLRRTGGRKPPDDVIRLGDLTINRHTYEVRRKKEPLDLSATEFRLLLHLAESAGRVFSREQLLDAVWKDEAFVEPRTVDVHVRRLRLQIEKDPADPEYIKTRRGVGYYVEKVR